MYIYACVSIGIRTWMIEGVLCLGKINTGPLARNW